jgi:hypothetical protein
MNEMDWRGEEGGIRRGEDIGRGWKGREEEEYNIRYNNSIMYKII